jgi:FkbM family methyltransferase
MWQNNSRRRFWTETYGLKRRTTAKIVCNKAAYALFRMVGRPTSSLPTKNPWHWYQSPFSLRNQVIWSRSLAGWFSPENEAAMECMLHMEWYEPVDWIKLAEGQNFLDVGAFVGWHSIRAARTVGPSGRVVSLEPDVTNRRQLHKNLLLNDIKNCSVVPLAAWSKTGDEMGWYTEKSPDCCRIDPATRSATVKTTSLDDLVQNLSFEQLDWIKIDVEGAEAEVLSGAERTLRKFRPLLFVEIHDTVPAVRDLLGRYGYSIRREEFDASPEPHGWVLARPAQVHLDSNPIVSDMS